MCDIIMSDNQSLSMMMMMILMTIMMVLMMVAMLMMIIEMTTIISILLAMLNLVTHRDELEKNSSGEAAACTNTPGGG